MQQQQDPFADFAARATRAYERIAAAFVRDLERMRPAFEQLDRTVRIEDGHLVPGGGAAGTTKRRPEINEAIERNRR